MKQINVNYKNQNTIVYIENNLLKNISNLIDQNIKYFIITDETVYNLYAQDLNLKDAYFKIIPPGEQSKNIMVVQEIIEAMLELNIHQGDVLINFGGGVISDIGGFVASIYKRGIEYYNIPTTLVAQVDAAIGGKTSIDYSYKNQIFKNQVGTIYQPKFIFVDPHLLNTLLQEDYLSGLGEIIKYGLCFDEKLFNELGLEFTLEEVIFKCLAIKAKITEADEFDKNIRISLNYGHTIGHAIEAISNFHVPHGIAILYGMLIETEDEEIKKRIKLLINKFNIELKFKYKNEKIINYILVDKKIENEYLKLPVLEKIGSIKINKVKLDDYIKRLL